MEIFDVSLLVIVFGLLGYVWKLRKQITGLIPGEMDDKVIDTIEGAAEALGIDVDALAQKSRGKLKKTVRKRF